MNRPLSWSARAARHYGLRQMMRRATARLVTIEPDSTFNDTAYVIGVLCCAFAFGWLIA